MASATAAPRCSSSEESEGVPFENDPTAALALMSIDVPVMELGVFGLPGRLHG